MKKIYIFTKLFNVNDRMTSLELCKVIDQWIEEGSIGKKYAPCFLPYRDSNELVKSAANQTLEIFQKDCECIRNAAVLVGYLDGPIYDSGIGFELGYAYTFGIPIVILTSDYFYIKNNTNKYSVSCIASQIAHVIHIREANLDVNNYEQGLQNIKKQMFDRLQKQLNVALAMNNRDRQNKYMEKDIDLLIDPAFLKYEGTKNAISVCIEFLHEKGKKVVVLPEGHCSDVKQIEIYLKRSRAVCIYGENFDFSVDSAILQGMAYGMKIEIWLYFSYEEELYKDDDFILNKNPMIFYSAKKHLHTISQVIDNVVN